MTLAAHSHSTNSIDWCRTSSNTPSICPKHFSTLPLNPNPQAAVLWSLSSINNSSCFRLLVSIAVVKAGVMLCSVWPRAVIVCTMEKEKLPGATDWSWSSTIKDNSEFNLLIFLNWNCEVHIYSHSCMQLIMTDNYAALLITSIGCDCFALKWPEWFNFDCNHDNDKCITWAKCTLTSDVNGPFI